MKRFQLIGRIKMNNELFPEIVKKAGQRIKAWCCDKELDCELKIFSNGTRHAWGTCPICKKTNAKAQRLPPSLDDLNHRLKSVYAAINAMPNGLDKEEAVAMVERLASDLGGLIT